MASRSIKNRPSIKKKHPSVGLLAVLVIFVAVVAAGGVGVYALGTSWIGDLTEYDVSQVENFNVAQPSEVYAADGVTKLAKFQLENREPVELDQVSPYVLEGTVATEDERFYEHGGFDVLGIMRAAVVTLTGSGREGASTITQQFVRNTVLADEMNDLTLARKVREMYLSVKLEEAYSKDAILRMYLNTINYGNATYGIQAASLRYFSKNATDLTLAEAATLIGIPQSPSYNDPISNPDNCLVRRNIVLDRMLTNGKITQEEHDAAQAEPLVLNETVPSNDGILAYPYFTSYVRSTLLETYSQAEVFEGGLKIITTLDITTQQAAEQAVAAKEEWLDEAISGSLVAIDPDTGHVKALVGGKDYYANQTNLATGQGTNSENPGRPCGSSFKMFTLVTALEEGINPQTMIDCSSPSSIPNTPYESTNYNSQLQNINNINYGTRSIQRAFAVSSNTGFVRLQMAVGTEKVIETAQRLGITSPLSNVASLTLGQQNVTMLDMASAYSAIANGGTKYPAQPILQIYDHEGNIIADNSVQAGTQVVSPEVAHAAIEVMKSVVNTYEGTGQGATLYNGQEVAAKTGTSSSYKDITFCGITPQLSVAIWFGDPTSQVQLPTSVGADDVFHDFMTAVLADQPNESFPYAENPVYQASYSNSTYHIGGYYTAPNTGGNGNSTKDDEAKDSPEAATEDAPSGATAAGASGGGTTSGGTTSGGTTSGGTTSGGTTSGGTTGGTSGGGTSGGGTSGGGTSGGGTSGGGTSGGGTSGGGTSGGGTSGGGTSGGGTSGGGTSG